MLFTHREITETLRMIEADNLDIRTVTLGISLLDCVVGTAAATRRKIKEKVCRTAEKLVAESDRIALEFGIPIINKRISVTPIALVAASSGENDLTPFAATLDDAAGETGVDFIGGFSALVEKGFTTADRRLLDSLPRALAETERVCGSVNLGTTRSGINMDAVAMSGRILKEAADLTAERDGIACAKLVLFCNAPGDNPFMAGAFHGPGEPEVQVNVGVSGPGVVKAALEGLKRAPIDEVAETIKKTAFKVTRMGQLVAREASRRLGYPFGIVDLSLAPTPTVGDSVARILEEMGLEVAGCPGTTAALALLNDAVKKGGLMASSHVGGLSGAFIPVSEDEGMIAAVEKGAMTLDKLESMTCVCSVGLDMIALPGDVSEETLSGIVADEMALGMVNNKTTGVRIIPVPGKGPGERAVYGGLLGEAPIMTVSPYSCRDFIARGGRFPAPTPSYRN